MRYLPSDLCDIGWHVSLANHYFTGGRGGGKENLKHLTTNNSEYLKLVFHQGVDLM